MKKFKISPLYLALFAAVGTVGVEGIASATNINGNGLGQVLIYPYYTTRAQNDTYLSVVNTTNSTKAVKVRFTEGKNSREVLDFNLYLSPYDVWTGAVVNTDTGAKLITADNSCTAPAIPAGGVAFTNIAYSGALPREGVATLNGWDGEDKSLDRTREGYFEIIEMAEIRNAYLVASIKHNSLGVPANCLAVQGSVNMSAGSGDNTPNTVLNGVTYPAESAQAFAATGGLAGTASLISPLGGTDYGYDPVVLEAFTIANIWQAPGSIRPDLRDGSIFSEVLYNGTVRGTTWSNSAQAVSAVLMHANIINEYVLDDVTKSKTDWVITMPTKRYFVPVDAPSLMNVVGGSNQNWSATPPFTTTFWTGGACEAIDVSSYFNREEGRISTSGFSPRPTDDNALCWETNVLTFNNGNLLGSTNSVNIPVAYQNGWMSMSFATAGHEMTGSSDNVPGQTDTYVGLPTVGFMLQNFRNDNLSGVLSSYGGNFNHKYKTQINPVNAPL